MKKWPLYIAGISYLISSLAFSAWNNHIFQVSTQKEISSKELTTRLSKAHMIVLGEIHNTPAIQLAQSLIINDVVKTTHQEKYFITAWEFLNYTDQDKINIAYKNFSSGKINALDFLQETQGTTSNSSYTPILETTKALQGQMIGVNLSREIKQVVVKSGIDALDQEYLPPDFAMGSAGYHQRFLEMMGDHTPADTVENYYAAQCLTDDVMAYTIHKNSSAALMFLITGSFHSDYYDGVVNRINLRLADNATAVVRFIDASDYEERELENVFSEILHDKAYGDIADYAYFVNEPIRIQNHVTL